MWVFLPYVALPLKGDGQNDSWPVLMELWKNLYTFFNKGLAKSHFQVLLQMINSPRKLFSISSVRSWQPKKNAINRCFPMQLFSLYSIRDSPRPLTRCRQKRQSRIWRAFSCWLRFAIALCGGREREITAESAPRLEWEVGRSAKNLHNARRMKQREKRTWPQVAPAPRPILSHCLL
jgi:hypothetical protein